MHAASVHPEPGSNSLNHGYLYPKPSRSRDKNTFFRVLSSLNALYFFELFKVFFEIPHTAILFYQVPVIRISVVQFSRTNPPLSYSRLFEYNRFFLTCQPFFSDFFQNKKESVFRFSDESCRGACDTDCAGAVRAILRLDFQPVIADDKSVLCRFFAEFFMIVTVQQIVREVRDDEYRLAVGETLSQEPLFHHGVRA